MALSHISYQFYGSQNSPRDRLAYNSVKSNGYVWGTIDVPITFTSISGSITPVIYQCVAPTSTEERYSKVNQELYNLYPDCLDFEVEESGITGHSVITWKFDPSAITGIAHGQYYSFEFPINPVNVASTLQDRAEFVIYIDNRVDFTGVTGLEYVSLPTIQGQTGVQGQTGISGGGTGLQGPTGQTGIQGQTGISGGGTGLQGPTGQTGIQGPQGGTGVQGPQGQTGIQGPQGGTGVQGPQGLEGQTGIQGPQGQTGIQGPQGGTGLQGPQGQTGIQGPQGQTGIAGQTGLQGPTGQTGIQGPQGGTGVQGLEGQTGLQGPTGQTGIQGPTGQTGVQGLEGQTGIQGPQGGTGVQGPQGLEGQTGIQGPQGQTGIQGPTGQTGIQGPQGQTGLAGTQGSTGLAGLGVTGLEGQTGVQGPQGSTGLSGLGVTGIAGQTGLAGTPGSTGATGIQGLGGTLSFTVSAPIGAVATGIMGQYKFPANFTLSSWELLATPISGATGVNCTVDIRKSSFAFYPDTTSLCGATGLYITNDDKNFGGSSSFTAGATGLAGDVIRATVMSTDSTAAMIDLNLSYTL